MDFDLTHLMVIGFAAVAICALAWFADHRRMHRSDPDAVGWMPWTPLFFWALVVACIALGLAAALWIKG